MKILLAFGTLTGNTENVAKYLAESELLHSHETKVVDQSDLAIENLSDYDLVVLGASTWGDGEPNPITEDFLDRLNTAEIDFSSSKTKFAIYGLGDSSYEYFCTACDKLEISLTQKGAKVLTPLLRIDNWDNEKVNHVAMEWMQKLLD